MLTHNEIITTDEKRLIREKNTKLTKILFYKTNRIVGDGQNDN